MEKYKNKTDFIEFKRKFIESQLVIENEKKLLIDREFLENNFIRLNKKKKELLDWIKLDKLNWDNLSLNPSAIFMLFDIAKKNYGDERINWVNVAKNENGYYMFNYFFNFLQNSNSERIMEIKKHFFRNSPYINFFEIFPFIPNYYISGIDGDIFDLFCNSHAKKLIDKVDKILIIRMKNASDFENMKQKKVIKLHYLASCGNNLLLSELDKYIKDKNGKKNYNIGKYYIDTVPMLKNLIYERKIPNMERYCEMLRYTTDTEYIENRIKHILYGDSSMHKSGKYYPGICTEMKNECHELTFNIFSYPIIEKYVKRVRTKTEEFNMKCIFYAMSSKEYSCAIRLLERYTQYIDWAELSKNSFAIHLLEKNIEKIDWNNLSLNKNIFKYDYEKMRSDNQNLYSELVKYVYEPKRILRKSIEYNMNFEKYIESLQ